MKTKSMNSKMLIIGCVLFVFGLICYLAMQVSAGVPASTNYPFGLYLAMFFCFAGAACGLAVVALLTTFGVFPELAGKHRRLYAGTLALLVTAGITITFLDCGQPARVPRMLFAASGTSLVSWDFFSLITITILSFIALMRKGQPSKVLAILAAIAATFVVVVEALILFVTADVDLWNSALMVVIYLLEAYALGCTLALFAAGMESRALRLNIGGALIALAVIQIIELIGGIYVKSTASALFTTGYLAPMFWLTVVVGLVVPAVLLFRQGTQPSGVKVASVLAILGVIFDKLAVILAGEAPIAAGSILTEGSTFIAAGAPHTFNMTRIAIYQLSFMEVAGVIGALGIALAVFALLDRIASNDAVAQSNEVESASE